MQIIREHAVFDGVLFHEFGHLAYYRKMLGAAQYTSEHACNLSGSCVSFPACGGCVGHEWNKDIGPEAAMMEGWADFFEAVTTRVLNPNTSPSWSLIENPNSWKPAYTIANGPGVEIWVAAYLWDVFDNPGGTDDDPVLPSGNAQQRYNSVASYFVNMPLSSELRHVWVQRIKPTLSPTGLSQHQTALALNTLASVY